MTQAPRPILLVDIDGVLNPFGTEDCPDGFTEHELFPDDEQAMRFDAVALYVDDDQPVAWIDDDLGPEARGWAGARRGPTLLVDVDPSIGVHKAHVAELLEWVDQLDRRAALEES